MRKLQRIIFGRGYKKSLTTTRLEGLRRKAGRRGIAHRHPIEVAVEKLIHSIFDIRVCSESYIPASREARKNELDGCSTRLDELEKSLTGRSEGELLAAREVSELQKVVMSIRRISVSRAPQILQESLFVHLFSVFDTFIGDLIVALFKQRPELFRALDRQVAFRQMLETPELSAVKQYVLAEEIEALRRNSYVDQFKWIEKFFDIKIREWKDWPAFIEASQRRNLYVHANGIVSEQYLLICKAGGYRFSSPPLVGERMPLKDRYFYRVSELVFDAGVQLAHTLWRKVLGSELSAADDSLISLVYELLLSESWGDARRTGHFFVSQRAFSDDLKRRIAVINLAIAIKFAGSMEYMELVDREDWSSSIPEFSLAIAVLNDDFDKAAMVMEAIGKSGTLINEIQYHQWPLLKRFRESSQFLESYCRIYGRDFIARAEEVAR